MGKIGLGIVTYNAPEKIISSAFSIPKNVIDEFVIVNDGTPYEPSCYPPFAHVIQHEKNMKVAKTKNDALRFLIDKGCDHLFLMEDDVIIKNEKVFQQYIDASYHSGIMHFNFALQGPHNFKKIIGKHSTKGDLTDRIFDEDTGVPNPIYTIEYPNQTIISFYPACVGAFSYFRREVIEKVGYFNENFQNSWEHVEHTYQIIKQQYHPPFGWFADLSNSNSYLDNIPNCMENSTIAKDPSWKENSVNGEQYFKKLHGFIPGKIPKTSKVDFLTSLQTIYSTHAVHFTDDKNSFHTKIANEKAILNPFIKWIRNFKNGLSKHS